MTKAQYLKNLTTPSGKIDVVLDTDTYNEIDDQFALCYMLRSTNKINIKGICAAPYFNERSTSPKDGMERSYNEIFKLLKLAKSEEYSNVVYKGSETYLENETTPVESEAADFMAELANKYSPEKPLYIVAIGAITNVASAILKNPNIKENCVVVWLGGHATHIDNPVFEFNMRQDVAAARVVFGSGVPLVQLPCGGVVDRLAVSKFELEHWIKGKSELCDYLFESTVEEAEKWSPYETWVRVIWDISPICWLLNDDEKFMRSKQTPVIMPEYDGSYSYDENRNLMSYVYWLRRDAIFDDLFSKLKEFK